MKPRKLTRRKFVQNSSAVLTASLLTRPLQASAAESHQATGVKVGEITPTSAIIWTRLTAHPTRNNTGLSLTGPVKKDKSVPVTVPIEQLEGASPPAAGKIRIRYSTTPDLTNPTLTDWADVSPTNDSTHQFPLTNLKPDTLYHYAVETSGPKDSPAHAPLQGKFHTAPSTDSPTDLKFCVMTCQGYHDRDHAEGHHIYPSMQSLNPRFVAYTGDNVYYDSELPQATSPELAHYHWQRMDSLPRHIELHRHCAGYWTKDDHDTLSNDSWAGMKMGNLEFATGQDIFRQQVPLAGKIYRTFRWGHDLQIWFTDGRDFRSPNDIPDGPEKTIWGKEQKEWLKRTLLESNATWKILISPTPIVGPDRGKKNDNHANSGFQHEGDEIRRWFKENLPDNFFVICGDRHWQYHSVHPQTGLHEFSVGPASDAHAAGSPGLDKTYHRFHLVKGGFLSVTLKREANQSHLTTRHHDVHGHVVYEWSQQRPVKT